MTNDGARQDQAWPGAVHWDLGQVSTHATEQLWKCDVLRAGKVYSSSLFGSQVEAEEFAEKLRQTEPDHMLSVEKILASAVWN
jgi:hypothetical protein